MEFERDGLEAGIPGLRLDDSMRVKAIIFDFDGTVANTLPVVFKAFRRAFIEHTGRCYSDEEIAPMFGPNEEGVCRNVVGEGYEAAYRVYLDEYEKVHDALCGDHFAGLVEALESLRASGVKLGIVTGKGRESAEISMRRLGLSPYFDAVEAGSLDGSIKRTSILRMIADWGIAPEDAAYVGDAPSDVRIAREAGVIPLAAAWADTADLDVLRASEPAAVFRTVDEMVEWLDGNG
jgi:phosphoglycolate phosphatase/pyrophosphatase PpaX